MTGCWGKRRKLISPRSKPLRNLGDHRNVGPRQVVTQASSFVQRWLFPVDINGLFHASFIPSVFFVQNNYVVFIVRGMTRAIQMLKDSRVTASCTFASMLVGLHTLGQSLFGFTNVQILAITVGALESIYNVADLLRFLVLWMNNFCLRILVGLSDTRIWWLLKIVHSFSDRPETQWYSDVLARCGLITVLDAASRILKVGCFSLSALWNVQLRYPQRLRADFRCLFSSSLMSLLDEIVSALWKRVLITPNLWIRGWCESK